MTLIYVLTLTLILKVTLTFTQSSTTFYACSDPVTCVSSVNITLPPQLNDVINVTDYISRTLGNCTFWALDHLRTLQLCARACSVHGPCRAFAFDVEDARCRLCDAEAFDLDIGMGDLGDEGDFIESGLYMAMEPLMHMILGEIGVMFL